MNVQHSQIQFEKIYNKTKVKTFYYIYSFVQNYETAQDLLNDTYLKALENENSFFNSPNKIGYIMVTAKNLAINYLNRKKKIVFENIDSYENSFSGNSDFEKVNLPVISLAKEHLEKDEFSALLLIEVAGFKRKEVARLLNLSLSGVNYKRDLAISKMKKVLEEYYE